VLLLLIFLFYLWVDHRFKYWENKGFPQFKPLQIPYGNVKGAGKVVRLTELGQVLYEQFKGKAKAVGFFIFISPILYIIDLDLIKSILIKDFNNFVDRGIYFNAKSDPLSANLFFIHGDYWKTMRLKLSPTFTSGKMKLMFDLVLNLSEDMVKFVEKNFGDLNVKDTMACYTTDVIGNIAFGLDLKCMETPNSKFREIGQKVFDSFNLVKQFFLGSYYKYTKHMGFTVFQKDGTDFFINIVKKAIEYREKNNVRRNDFLDLMIQLKNKGKVEGDETIVRKLTFDEVAAQCWLFYIAGFVTFN
jgi:cytochrome P450 family 6